MRVVDHDKRLVLVREIAYLLEGGYDAVHREDAVGDDELEARTGLCRRLQLLFEVGHVAVRVAEALRLAETDAVDDRRVVEGVGDYRVIGPEKRLEDAAVRVEARAEEDAVVGLGEVRDDALELLVERVRSADEADGAHAVAVLRGRLARRLDYLGVVREPEIVVRAHVEKLRAVLEDDVGALGDRDDLLVLVEALRLEVSYRLLEMRLELSVHYIFPFKYKPLNISDYPLSANNYSQSRITLPDLPDIIASKPFS